jgi:hypothetical protein
VEASTNGQLLYHKNAEGTVKNSANIFGTPLSCLWYRGLSAERVDSYYG